MKNSTKIGGGLLAFGLALTLGIGQSHVFSSHKEARAEAWNETIDFKQIGIKYAKEVVDNSEADYSTSTSGKFRFGVRHGYLLNGTVEKFGSVTGDGSSSCDFKVTADDVSHAELRNWRFDALNSDGCIVFITALEPMSISVDAVTIATAWFDAGVYNNYYVQLNGESDYHLIKSQKQPVKNEATFAPLEAVNLSAGDTLYYEFVSTSTGTAASARRNVQLSAGNIPTFKLSGALVDVDTSIVMNKLLINYATGVKAKSTLDFSIDPTVSFKYYVRHGSVGDGEIQKYDDVTAPSSDSCVYAISTDTEGQYSNARNWIFRTNDGDGIILGFEALQALTFKFEGAEFGGSAGGCYITIYLLNKGATEYKLIKNTNITEAEAKLSCGVDRVIMDAGDTVLWEFRRPDDSGQRGDSRPNIQSTPYPTFQFKSFDLEAYKEEAKTALANYKDPDDYRSAQQTELTNIINSGNDAIDAATISDGVDAALAAAKQQLDAVKTDAELTAEEAAAALAQAKVDAKAELDNYKAASLYREAQQTELATAIANGKAAIDEAADIAGVNTALANAKTAIDAIKTDAQLTEEEAAELASYKNQKKAALDAWVTAHLSEYRQAQQEQITAGVAQAKSDIDAAADKAAVDAIVSTLQGQLNNLKTDAQLTAQEHVDAFVALVDAIGTVEYTQACADKINAALAAYQALTAAEQAMVPEAKLTALTNAINEFSALQLAAYKQSAKDSIDEVVTAQFLAGYRAEQQQQINTLVTQAKSAIDAAQTKAAVDQIMTSLGQALAQIPTDADLSAGELGEAKTAAKAELASYKNPTDYREAEQTQLATIVTTGNTAIDAATTVEGVQQALAAAKAQADALKTKAAYEAEEAAQQPSQPEPEVEPQPEQPAKKGCRSSVLAASALISTLALAGFGLLLSKKKER